MKFSEFAKNNTFEQKANKQQKNNESIEDMYEKYKDFSQSQLMDELSKQVAKQKKEGNFDFEKIMNSVNSIMPYLNDEQKQNIIMLLNNLK